MSRLPDGSEAEGRLQAALSRSGIGTWDWNLGTDLVSWNEAHAHILGLQNSPLVQPSSTFRNAVHAEDLPHLEEAMERAAANREPFRHGFRIRRAPDGQVRRVVVRGLHFFDDYGRPIRITGLLADVTNRDEMDESLRQSEARHRVVFERNPVPLYTLPRGEAQFSAVNEAAARLLGWSRNELERINIADLFVPGDFARARDIIEQHKGGMVRAGIFTLRTKSQEQVVVDTVVELAIIDGREEFLISTTDLTDRIRAESAMRESEELFRVGFEAAATPTAIVDGQGRYLRVNQALAELFHSTREELVQRAFIELTHEEERERDWTLFTEMREGVRNNLRLQKRYRRLDESIIWADVNAVVLRRENGRASMILVEITDQTALRSLLGALRESEARLGFALDASNDGLWDWNYATGELFINPAWETMLGYEPGDLKPHIDTWASLVHPEDVDRPWAALQEHIAGRIASMETEIRMRHKDGSWKWVLNRGKIVDRAEDGTPIRIVGTHVDITKARAAAAAIAAQAEILDTILSNIPIMIAFFSAEGRIDWINRHWTTVLGWTLEEMADRDMMAEFYPEPSVRDAVHTFLRESPVEWRDFPIRTRDGAERITSWTNVRLADGRSLGIGYDVTDVRLAERARRGFELQLQQTQKLESLGVLAGGIAHDFNNLLVGILGNAELALQDAHPGSTSQELLGEIKVSATRAADLTRQLLAYAGKGRFVVEQLDLSSLIEEMLSLLRTVVSKRAHIITEFGRDLPIVKADATQLRQIVMNLITNASDALENQDGWIAVRTGVTPLDAEFRREAHGAAELPDGEYVYLEVEDNGTGMDEATLARIFDPFFTTKFTGRGLGLASTLGIIRSHEGAIRVRSTPGRGTTVRIVLSPLSRVPVAAPVSTAPAAPWRGHGIALLADDEAMVRQVTRRALERAGFTVVECVDGAEAIECFRQRSAEITLVVLDLTMPAASGDAALREMRKLVPALPAVLYSGYSEEDIDQLLVRDPHVRFVQKPFTPSTLARAAQEAMGE